MAVTYIGNGIYLGLAGDTKPTTGVATNAIFVTTNKPAIHYYNGSAWQTDVPSLTTAQTFTAVQTIDIGGVYPVILQRVGATPGQDVGISFNEPNSAATLTQFAAFRGGIAAGGATAGSENGTIKFLVMVAGSLTPCLWIDGADGQIRLGPGASGGFLRLSASGLSSARLFTYPDADAKLVGETTTQTITNKTLGTTTMSDAANIVLNATTGTKIGTGTTQKLGFHNATPVVQAAFIASPAADLTELKTAVDALRTLLIDKGLMAAS